MLVDQSTKLDAKSSRKVLRGLLSKLLQQCLEFRFRRVLTHALFELHARHPNQLLKIVRGFQRKIDVGKGPRKSRRENTHNCVVFVSHSQSHAQDIGASAKMPLPK